MHWPPWDTFVFWLFCSCEQKLLFINLNEQCLKYAIYHKGKDKEKRQATNETRFIPSLIAIFNQQQIPLVCLSQKFQISSMCFPNSGALKKTLNPLGYDEKDQRERYRETEVRTLRSEHLGEKRGIVVCVCGRLACSWYRPRGPVCANKDPMFLLVTESHLSTTNSFESFLHPHHSFHMQSLHIPFLIHYISETDALTQVVCDKTNQNNILGCNTEELTAPTSLFSCM